MDWYNNGRQLGAPQMRIGECGQAGAGGQSFESITIFLMGPIHERAIKDLKEKVQREFEINLQSQRKKSRELDRQFEIFRDMRRESDLVNKRIYRELMSEIEHQSEKMDYKNIEKVLSEASEKLKDSLPDVKLKKRPQNVIDSIKNEDGDDK